MRRYTILYPLPQLKIGGTEQQLLELVRGLDKQRFKPIVAMLHPGGGLEAEFRAVAGVELVQLNRRGKWDFSPIWKIAALIRDRQVDVVQPFLPPTTSFGTIAAVLARRSKTIMTERSGARRDIDFYIRLQDLLSRVASCVVANSDAGRTSLVERGVPPSKLRVIPNGINVHHTRVDPAVVRDYRSRLGVGERGSVVGILATLLPIKRHDIFLRAAAALSSRVPGIRFAVFGDGPLRRDLEALASELGIDGQVMFFGLQRGVANCLAACDLLVSCSEIEGLSNSIMEAMVLGVPVVATNIPGNNELVHDGSTGYLVPLNDALALADRIAYALDHPSETEAYVDRARRWIASEFSLERMVERHVHLYESLVGSGVRGFRHREA